MKALPIQLKACPRCGTLLQRRSFSGRIESPSMYAKRKFCSRRCNGLDVTDRRRETDVKRFWRLVLVGSPDECWEWQGSRERAGYGKVKRDKKKIKTHRLAWLLTNGSIPDGLEVCHHCDNPLCVNPAHLFLGTHADNMADMARKGRGRSGATKLSEDDVRAIRASPERHRALARRYGVDEVTILQARRRITWKRVA